MKAEIKYPAVVLNSGMRIPIHDFPLKDLYTKKETKEILCKYCHLLNRTKLNQNDYYCVLLNWVLDHTEKRFWGEHLYLMKSDNGLYKVGRSNNPKQRVLDLEFETGFKISIIATFKKAGDDEKMWHKKYKKKNVRFNGIYDSVCTEWFRLNDNDISTIFNNYGYKN